MPNPIRFEKKSIDNEALFLQQYEWLLKRARQITRGNAGEAEDLVQDLYVRFVHTSTSQPLVTDDQVRAYLYTALRNLHISKKIRSGRDAISGLRAVDFDSVKSAILSIERTQLLYVRSDLAQICEYVCGRRATSRAASALILRFFLSYLPPEIMALLKLTRSNVHSLIENSRVEAKAFIARRGNLRFMGATARRGDGAQRGLPEETGALFTELQERIFSTPDGSCFIPGQLEEIYRSDSGRSFDTLQIAHLVSCKQCLQTACMILRLPMYSSRSMEDHDHSGQEPPPPSDHSELNQLHRKLQETDEHRPKKLQLIVDGEVKSIQTITSVESRVQITLPPLYEPRFLEVFSEQGVGLLYLDLHQDSIEAPISLTAQRSMSGKRHLEVGLTLAEGAPAIELYYFDPMMEEMPETAEGTSFVEIEDAEQLPKTRMTFLNRVRRWLENLRLLPSHRLILIVLVTIVCFAGGAALLWQNQRQSRPAPLESTSSVINRSRQNARVTVPSDGGFHATYNLETLDRQKTVHFLSVVSIIRTPSSKQSRLRLHTSGGRLLAEQRTSADGKGTSFSAQLQVPYPEISRANPIWQHVPDVDDFLKMAQSARITISSNASGYELAFAQASPSTAPAIVAAHLQLNSETLRPIGESLEVTSGAFTSTYRFTETSYHVLNAKELAAELSSHDAVDGDTTKKAGFDSMPTPSLILRTLAILHETPEADRAVDIALVDGREIFLSGVLSSPASKELLLHRLAALHASSLHVRDLHVIGETTPQHRSAVQSTPIVSTLIAENADVIPLAALLQPAGELPLSNDALKTRAGQVLEASSSIKREVWLAAGMTDRWLHEDDIRKLSPKDQRLWVELVDDHLQKSSVALDGIAEVLHALDPSDPTAQPLPDLQSFTTFLNEFQSTSKRLDRLLVAGFSVSPQGINQPLEGRGIPALISSMRRQESVLARTIERLR